MTGADDVVFLSMSTIRFSTTISERILQASRAPRAAIDTGKSLRLCVWSWGARTTSAHCSATQPDITPWWMTSCEFSRS